MRQISTSSVSTSFENKNSKFWIWKLSSGSGEKYTNLDNAEKIYWFSQQNQKNSEENSKTKNHKDKMKKKWTELCPFMQTQKTWQTFFFVVIYLLIYFLVHCLHQQNLLLFFSWTFFVYLLPMIKYFLDFFLSSIMDSLSACKPLYIYIFIPVKR